MVLKMKKNHFIIAVLLFIMMKNTAVVWAQEKTASKSEQVALRLINNMVTLESNVGRGYGLITAAVNDTFYIATAGHLLFVDDPKTEVAIKVRFAALPGQVFVAQRLTQHLKKPLNMGIVRVTGVPAFEMETICKAPDDSIAGEDSIVLMEPVAQPGGEISINKGVLLTSDIYSLMKLQLDQTPDNLAGAPLISAHGIVGLLTNEKANPPMAIPIALIKQVILAWKLPWMLEEKIVRPHSALYERYDIVNEFREGMAAVGIRDSLGYIKYGYVNEREKEVIPLIYDLGSDFREGWALVNQLGKFSFINKRGETMLNLADYGGVRDLLGGLIWVIKAGKWGAVNRKGKVICPLEYEQVLTCFFDPPVCNHPMTAAKKAGKWGVLNAKGKVVIPFLYDEIRYFEHERAVFRINDKWGCMDKAGATICPAEYDAFGYFSNNLAPVAIGGQYGYTNLDGQLAIGLQYEAASEFMSQGMARVTKNGHAFFINKQGQCIKDCPE